MERWKTELLPLLPRAAQSVLEALTEEDRLLEIRLRAGQPMQLVFEDRDRLVHAPGGGAMLNESQCAELLSAFCEQSVYAWEEELSRGFLTVRGGYRVGIAGRAMHLANGRVRYTAVTGFCIRIVRERRDCAKSILPFAAPDGRLRSVLLLSPPGCGKTTLLRDLIRIVSDGLYGVRPMRVCAADERFELCGSSEGTRAFDLGQRTDIVSGLPKAEALERMLAALSPEVLATDELSSKSDIKAMHRAKSCGVAVIATAHAQSLDDLWRRPFMRALRSDRVFDRIVLLCDRPVGTVAAAYDADGHPLLKLEKSA